MSKIPRWAFIAGAVVLAAIVIAVIFIRDAQTPLAPVALPLTETFDDSPTGFTLMYPEEWDYVIPVPGVMVMGPPQTLFENEPGPSLTIQRSDPLTVVETLDAVLNRYFQLGP